MKLYSSVIFLWAAVAGCFGFAPYRNPFDGSNCAPEQPRCRYPGYDAGDNGAAPVYGSFGGYGQPLNPGATLSGQGAANGNPYGQQIGYGAPYNSYGAPYNSYGAPYNSYGAPSNSYGLASSAPGQGGADFGSYSPTYPTYPGAAQYPVYRPEGGYGSVYGQPGNGAPLGGYGSGQAAAQAAAQAASNVYGQPSHGRLHASAAAQAAAHLGGSGNLGNGGYSGAAISSMAAASGNTYGQQSPSYAPSGSYGSASSQAAANVNPAQGYGGANLYGQQPSVNGPGFSLSGLATAKASAHAAGAVSRRGGPSGARRLGNSGKGYPAKAGSRAAGSVKAGVSSNVQAGQGLSQPRLGVPLVPLEMELSPKRTANPRPKKVNRKIGAPKMKKNKFGQ